MHFKREERETMKIKDLASLIIVLSVGLLVAVPAGAQQAATAQQDVRVEHDLIGEKAVPADAYYGAQTQRAVDNFPISGWQLPPAMISAVSCFPAYTI